MKIIRFKHLNIYFGSQMNYGKQGNTQKYYNRL